MQILVVSATTMEIAPFLSRNISADHLVTGVGSPACIYQLIKKIQQKKYDFIIQAGIAGTFSDLYVPGDSVIVRKDIFADLGSMEKNQLINLFEMGLANLNEYPYTGGWLISENEIISKSHLKKISAITVNTVSDDLKLRNLYLQKYQPEIESMEGAALHYVCLQEKINFLQIRTISNKVGDRDKGNWKIKTAIEQLNTELINLIHQVQANQ